MLHGQGNCVPHVSITKHVLCLEAYGDHTAKFTAYMAGHGQVTSCTLGGSWDPRSNREQDGMQRVTRMTYIQSCVSKQT